MTPPKKPFNEEYEPNRVIPIDEPGNDHTDDEDEDFEDFPQELDRIMRMSDEELKQEFKAQGLDWDIEVKKADAIFELAFADAEFEKAKRGM